MLPTQRKRAATLRKELDAAFVSAPLKAELRSRIEGIQKKAVDAKPDSEICITDYMREQRLKRLSAGKLKTKTSQQEGESMSVDSKEWTRGDATGAFPEATLGKRKRGMKAGGSLDLLDDDSGQSQCKLENMSVPPTCLMRNRCVMSAYIFNVHIHDDNYTSHVRMGVGKIKCACFVLPASVTSCYTDSISPMRTTYNAMYGYLSIMWS